jgi:hypothetical protein
LQVLLKTAPTFLSTNIVKLQDPSPEQSPVQPAKIDWAPAAAVRVVAAPAVYPALHAAPQLILLSALVTVPVPAPDLVTVKTSLQPARVPLQKPEQPSEQVWPMQVLAAQEQLGVQIGGQEGALEYPATQHWL